MRWPILSQNVHMNPVALGSYEAEVDRLKNFLCMRIDWMDRKLGYTRRPLEGSTAVDNQQINDNCRKIIRNGQLLIIRNGVEYTVTGEVRTGK